MAYGTTNHARPKVNARFPVADNQLNSIDIDTKSNVRLLRQFDRRRTALRAILYHGDTFQSTVIRDVSKGGVGLEGGMSLLPGDKVHLHLMSGHSYRGTVRWWCGGYCGVSFDRLLAADDVLLLAARKKAR